MGMMYEKAMLFGDHGKAVAILSGRYNPREYKRLGRRTLLEQKIQCIFC
jgi:predicted NAD-dependent protein-ADP-ribosyltransferase YbiA (DUF1768 family)